MSPKNENLLIPSGSLILVTGANGFIASHVVDQLLHYGYSVRGTVRSTSRSAWLKTSMSNRHPSSTFDLVEVPDYLNPTCYTAALKGVSAVIHTPSNVSFANDPSIITEATTNYLNLLTQTAAANNSGESISRVVLTSSSWTVRWPQPNIPATLTASSYDTNVESLATSPPTSTPTLIQAAYTYAASKIASERASWNWHASHSSTCAFTLNTVLPAITFGPPLDPLATPYPSTTGMLRMMYEGIHPEVVAAMQPQFFVDVRDAARLHVAAAILADVEGERVFAWAKKFDVPDAAAALEKEMGKEPGIWPAGEGKDLTTLDEKVEERARGLLVRLGCEGWVGLEKSVGEGIRVFYPES